MTAYRVVVQPQNVRHEPVHFGIRADSLHEAREQAGAAAKMIQGVVTHCEQAGE